MSRPDLGAQWVSSISDLALAYGVTQDEMQQRVYALAEQIHTHYCFNSGPVNHRESRPDEHIAAGILSALVGADWWMVKSDERSSTPRSYIQGCGYWMPVDGTRNDQQIDEWWGCTIPDAQHRGRDHVLAKFTRAEVMAEQSALMAAQGWSVEQEATVDTTQG